MVAKAVPPRFSEISGREDAAASAQRAVPRPKKVLTKRCANGGGGGGSLSRFYKSKAQSFARLSEALNTEYGTSALGLAKRHVVNLSAWPRHPAPASSDGSGFAEASFPGSQQQQQQQQQLLLQRRGTVQDFTEEACTMLQGLRVSATTPTTGSDDLNARSSVQSVTSADQGVWARSPSFQPPSRFGDHGQRFRLASSCQGGRPIETDGAAVVGAARGWATAFLANAKIYS